MALECNAWLPGSVSAADQFGVYTFGEVEKKILDYLGPVFAKDTQLIKGFFSNSLTPTLKSERGMKPALIVDVDVDLYISCYQCLDWMFAQGLMAAGTIAYYDDVSIVKTDGGGELRAHPLRRRAAGVDDVHARRRARRRVLLPLCEAR